MPIINKLRHPLTRLAVLALLAILLSVTAYMVDEFSQGSDCQEYARKKCTPPEACKACTGQIVIRDDYPVVPLTIHAVTWVSLLAYVAMAVFCDHWMPHVRLLALFVLGLVSAFPQCLYKWNHHHDMFLKSWWLLWSYSFFLLLVFCSEKLRLVPLPWELQPSFLKRMRQFLTATRDQQGPPS